MVHFLEMIRTLGSRKAFRILDVDNSFDVSFERFYREAEQCAYNLKKIIGELERKRIGLYCTSSYEYTVMITAMMFSRAVAVPLNIRESTDVIEYEVKNADVEYLVVDNDLFREKDLGIGILDKSDLIKANGGDANLTDFSDEEKDLPILIIYTSGTTGKPKGVVLTAENLFGFFKSMFDGHSIFENTTGLRIYTNFPFYHIGGINGWITDFEKECSTYISVNQGNVLKDLENESIDSAVVTPATLNLWKKTVAKGHIERLGGAKLLISAGAPVDISTVELFLENGIHYGQYYGMSESCGNISCNFDCCNHLKSVGKADPNLEVFIIEDEICAKGPGIMKGYYKNDEETKKTIIDGVLHTGDLGYIDADGYIYITGRKKNLIILSGGENISPEELEQKLYKCKYINECMVYAENDRICTIVYTDEENIEKVTEFISDMNSKLPIYKRIYKKVIQTEPLEKTDSGKIKRQ